MCRGLRIPRNFDIPITHNSEGRPLLCVKEFNQLGKDRCNIRWYGSYHSGSAKRVVDIKFPRGYTEDESFNPGFTGYTILLIGKYLLLICSP